MSSSLASSSLSVSSLATSGATISDLELSTTSSSSTLVQIIPLVTIDRVRLLSGIYGPFRPPSPATVPLWVALYLKKRKKAIIVPPTWLSVDSLTQTLRQETTSPTFSPLPHYWLGVAQSILAEASSDLPQSNKIRSLIKDIREARQSKILAGVGMINPVHLQMSNISAHEIAELRGFFATAFTHLKALTPPSEREKENKLQQELDERNQAQYPSHQLRADQTSNHPSFHQDPQGQYMDTWNPPDSQHDSYQNRRSESMSSSMPPIESHPSSSMPGSSAAVTGQYLPSDAAGSSSLASRPPDEGRPQDRYDENRPKRWAVDDDDDDKDD